VHDFQWRSGGSRSALGDTRPPGFVPLYISDCVGFEEAKPETRRAIALVLSFISHRSFGSEAAQP